MLWQRIGGYEHEYDPNRQTYTGWYRCVGGRLADGRWPEWHSYSGDKRYK